VAPTTVSATPQGVNNAVTGLFSLTRSDVNSFSMTEGYGRDGAVFTNTEPRTVTYTLGVASVPTTSGGIWAQEYTNIRQAQQILAVVGHIVPPYAPESLAAVTGVLQTLEAINYLMVIEAHDTLGMAILPAGNVTSPPPAVCMVDAWKYVIALFDSGDAQLNAAGAITIPLRLPSGFAGVSVAGPDHAVGTFGGLNRAYAAKANLELAYAVTRLAPITDSTNAIAPNQDIEPTVYQLAVTQAAADLAASGMYSEAGLAPNSSSGFTANSNNVNWDFSPASGDITNPIFGQIGTEGVLKDFIASVDTGVRAGGTGAFTTQPDARWAAKFVPNPNAMQQPKYNLVAQYTPPVGSAFSYLYNMSGSPSAPIPAVRDENLVLLNAWIHLAQGDFAGAIAKANLVRTQVGLLPLATPAVSFIGARNFVLSEQRISSTFESWDMRTIQLRAFGLQILGDTTWQNPGPPNGAGKKYTAAPSAANQESFPQTTYQDYHILVLPVPFSELSGRGEGGTGIFVTTCSGTP
jgi:hypothetical protein